MNKNKLIAFYVNELETNFWPFWEKAVDDEFGGVYTCYNNDASERISTNKYTWSQGRFLWIVCELYGLTKAGIIRLDAQRLREIADQTWQYLKNRALADNLHAIFALTRDGKPLEGQEDLSIYADYFLVLGINKYAEIFGNREAFELAKKVYETIKQRLASGDFKTEPYPVPASWAAHGLEMIRLNTVQELEATAKQWDPDYAAIAGGDVKALLSAILDGFTSEDGTISELTTSDSDEQAQTLLGRHINPGHSLESLWFQLHSLEHWEERDKERVIRKLSTTALRTLELGWDHQFGGLLRFVDREGGEPRGEKRDDPYEQLIVDTWDVKLWWPHSEALYSSLLFHEMTGEAKFMEWYQLLESYSFATFPNPDPQIREWIQIRSRTGEPLNKVVALPVKDPFHIIRNFILILKLL
ncbi:AGE family epimerase/isomerase [Paenibacillus sp. PAMC21692]|uniref:AGE family epimerase/isomerase n=1 Tax=Paenibacillus sp. PAMC21692 TaxID=2762320 RepID=UPI00164D8796|nr:AGE family epimerase/isomerase [Paenibacillus sp. PAMC21692]QNK57230.1 AGE family epimerase/isomerase [Paenibacillus sp. PAMC21692]